MPSYYCTDCGTQREFLNVKRTAERAQVTRATIYNWLKRNPLHVIVHPSGRRYICTSSILAAPGVGLAPEGSGALIAHASVPHRSRVSSGVWSQASV